MRRIVPGPELFTRVRPPHKQALELEMIDRYPTGLSLGRRGGLERSEGAAGQDGPPGPVGRSGFARGHRQADERLQLRGPRLPPGEALPHLPVT